MDANQPNPIFTTVTGLAKVAAARREELGLTQVELAQQIGKSREWLLRFERGNPGANLQSVLDLFLALGITLNTHSTPTRQPTFVVATSMEALHGPSTGEISLPTRILWNPSRPFDLSDDTRAATMLRLVLLEARKHEDLEDLIDPQLLRRLWGRLRLPQYLRDAWEQKFPDLLQARDTAHA